MSTSGRNSYNTVVEMIGSRMSRIEYLQIFWIVILASPEWNHRGSADFMRGYLPHADGSMQSNSTEPQLNGPSTHEHSQQSPPSYSQSWGERFEQARWGESDKSTLSN